MTDKPPYTGVHVRRLVFKDERKTLLIQFPERMKEVMRQRGAPLERVCLVERIKSSTSSNKPLLERAQTFSDCPAFIELSANPAPYFAEFQPIPVAKSGRLVIPLPVADKLGLEDWVFFYVGNDSICFSGEREFPGRSKRVVDIDYNGKGCQVAIPALSEYSLVPNQELFIKRTHANHSSLVEIRTATSRPSRYRKVSLKENILPLGQLPKSFYRSGKALLCLEDGDLVLHPLGKHATKGVYARRFHKNHFSLPLAIQRALGAERGSTVYARMHGPVSKKGRSYFKVLEFTPENLVAPIIYKELNDLGALVLRKEEFEHAGRCSRAIFVGRGDYFELRLA